MLFKRRRNKSEPDAPQTDLGPAAPPRAAEELEVRGDRRLLLCDELAQYVACLTHLGVLDEELGCRCFPLLGEEAHAARVTLYPAAVPEVTAASAVLAPDQVARGEPEGLLRLLWQHAADATSRHESVCWVEDDEWAFVGLAHAIATGKRPIRFHDESSLPDGVRSLTAVLSPATLGEVGVDQLQVYVRARTNGGDPCGIPWGILTAPDCAALSAVVAKLALADVPHESARCRVVWALGEAPRIAPDPEFRIHAAPDGPDRMTAELETPVPVTMVTGHGGSYCFTKGLICTGEPWSESSPMRCVGNFTCPFMEKEPDLRVTSADRLRSDVVLIDSCLAGSVQAVMVDGLNIATALLQGFPRAIIAPHRSHTPDPLLPYLAWTSMKRGLSLGATLGAINAESLRTRALRDPFVLFGDPDSVALDGSAWEPVPVDVLSSSEDSIRCVLPPPDAAVQLYSCSDTAVKVLEGADVVYAFLEDPAGGGGLFQTLTTTEAGVLEWVMVWFDRLSDTQRVICLTTTPPFDETTFEVGRGILDAVERTLDLPATDLGSEPVEEDGHSVVALRNDLSNLEPFLPNSLPFIASHGTELYGEVRDIDEALRAQLVEANRDVLDRYLRDQGDHVLMSDSFEGTRGGHNESWGAISEPCPRCSGSVHRRVYTIGLRRPHRRWVLECERCDVLCDVAEDSPLLFVDGPAGVPRRRIGEFRLSGTNRAALPMILHACVRVHTPGFTRADPPRFRVTPDVVDQVVPGGAGFELIFSVEPYDSAILHAHRIKAYACGNGQLMMAFQRMTVSPTEPPQGPP